MAQPIRLQALHRRQIGTCAVAPRRAFKFVGSVREERFFGLGGVRPDWTGVTLGVLGQQSGVGIAQRRGLHAAIRVLSWHQGHIEDIQGRIEAINFPCNSRCFNSNAIPGRPLTS